MNDTINECRACGDKTNKGKSFCGKFLCDECFSILDNNGICKYCGGIIEFDYLSFDDDGEACHAYCFNGQFWKADSNPYIAKMFKIYNDEIPVFINKLACTEAMLRLRGIDMNCGMRFTNFSKFKNIESYSKYEHSIGVGLIVWHFTKDITESIAAMLHDISTPTFAHVVDFMNGDHKRQESTEGLTEKFISDSDEIKKILVEYDVEVADVVDYHKYPIADNDSPKLSADRLEYTLSTFLYHRRVDLETIEYFYKNIIVGKNEQGELELTFKTRNAATDFSILALKNSYMYSSDSNRTSMEFLSELLKFAIEEKVISHDDLYSLSECSIIEKLLCNKRTKIFWEDFTNFSDTVKDSTKSENNKYSFKVDSKKRYIDPYIFNKSRLSSLDENFKNQINKFLSQDFNYFVSLYPGRPKITICTFS